uniref:Uncharacterized protein n=1 Tax=Pipistrellus kuhlii TaxID=59472 RepID=A0A7J7TAT9_PIPKU|nr:hypothetical protein mPipKuh1_009675 [Pipistrellus kuhlii]
MSIHLSTKPANTYWGPTCAGPVGTLGVTRDNAVLSVQCVWPSARDRLLGVMGAVMGKCRGALGQPRGIEKLLEGRGKLAKTLGMGCGLGKQPAKACRGGPVRGSAIIPVALAPSGGHHRPGCFLGDIPCPL